MSVSALEQSKQRLALAAARLEGVLDRLLLAARRPSSEAEAMPTTSELEVAEILAQEDEGAIHCNHEDKRADC
jgi:hypothetical protein